MVPREMRSFAEPYLCAAPVRPTHYVWGDRAPTGYDDAQVGLMRR